MDTPTGDLVPATDLLKAAYQRLGFDRGALRKVASEPYSADVETEDWIEQGDWLSLAKQVGAESLFFVDRDPVIVFANTEDTDKDALRELYGRIWCMSRPQLLFLATPGELSVFDLTKPPPRPGENINDSDSSRLIDTAKSVEEVQSRLKDYHRECVETGAVFGDSHFSDSLNRADHALIRDLKTVRRQLAEIAGEEEGNLEHLHSLIGRAIFIRYLEDRKIIEPDYFEEVAGQKSEWKAILDESDNVPALEPRFKELRFLRVLSDKDFTYALFDQLAKDFNGDTFPVSNEELDFIRQDHLNELRNFLTASTSEQQELFFFAYRFDVIPIELISTIYEEFYNERADSDTGSRYTPPALVEYVLARTLTPETLEQKPRVMDPACGSGIFLVESFRRMVRHRQTKQNGRRVKRNQLKKILRDQIVGIDVNKEAVSVAAFSLYLAYLHYQEPRDINQDRRLPHLKVPEDGQHQQTGESLNILLYNNSFGVEDGDYPDEVVRRFGSASVDVVVGNPPWGDPGRKDTATKKAADKALEWCEKHEHPVGDREQSQAFIHLTGNLLKEGGKAGLLVSSGVLFKRHNNSRRFRNVWLSSVQLKHVANFAHVRQVFFSGRQRKSQSIAPFISVVFKKAKPNSYPDDQFEYWSAKRTRVIENTHSVVLNRGDMHWLSQRDCLAYEKLWKIYWWGGHRDEALVRKIEMPPRLSDLSNNIEGIKLRFGRGFQVAGEKQASNWLKGYSELPSQQLEKYGPQPLDGLRPVPNKVESKGVKEIYSGRRLLVARGIKESGSITARFETQEYCFRNSVHGVRFYGFEEWQENIVTAVFWSSLVRYYYFITSGSWGFWHDEIHLEDVKNMPVLFPEDGELRNRIIRVVRELQHLKVSRLKLGDPSKLPALEQELDDAVFDLYQLNTAERDLVREMCETGLKMFYRKHGKEVERIAPPAQHSGILEDVSNENGGLSAYIRVFLESWNRETGTDGELAWRVITPHKQIPLLVVSFVMCDGQNAIPDNDTVGDWGDVLEKLNDSSAIPVGGSVFIDTFFRHVGDREILFIKRNEKRFWTRTAAREDVESVLAHLMNRGLQS